MCHSGGRDLSGNKRTNRQQSFDQKFTNGNEALRLSCRMGYPVRVVRLAVIRVLFHYLNTFLTHSFFSLDKLLTRTFLIFITRTYKEIIAAYAPEEGVRYDGVYRVEKCWRKVGVQVCIQLNNHLFRLRF